MTDTHTCHLPDCYVDPEGETTCGTRACPECASQNLVTTPMWVGTIEYGCQECGYTWAA